MKWLNWNPQLSLPPKERLNYPPIEHPRGIRLVSLLPGNRLTNVQCELRLASLDDNLLEYDALSYCWGETSRDAWISCNSQRLDITQNLLTALKRFRRNDSTVTFWIDQLCINQDDLRERSNQVRLMQDIYGRATNVFVWLGDSAGGSDKPFDFLYHVLKILHRHEASQGEGALNDNDLPKWPGKKWEVFHALVNSPWFGRTWILQELASASSATMVCGQQSMSWTDFSYLIVRLSESLWSPIQPTLMGSVLGTSTDLVRERILNVIKIKKDYNKEKKISLIHALQLARTSQATDPRDKVFALFGLIFPQIRQTFQPNYLKSVPEVYCRIAKMLLFRYSIPSDSLFGLLSEAEANEDGCDLPSWVPDWRVPNHVSNNSKKSFWAIHTAAGYTAAGTSLIEISETEDANKIKLQGKLCDTVHVTSAVRPGFTLEKVDPKTFLKVRSDDHGNELLWSPSITNIAFITESSSIAGSCHRYEYNGLDDAYSRTIIGNQGRLISDCLPRSLATDSDHATSYWHFRQYLAILYPGNVVNGAPLRTLRSLLASHEKGYLAFQAALIVVASNRRFFSTIGGYMGLGPSRMRPGDTICVFLGGAVPWVIRQDGEDYVLVGECYVHGLMNGEAMNTEYLPVQDVVIK